jgi:hypothetical protein
VRARRSAVATASSRASRTWWVNCWMPRSIALSSPNRWSWRRSFRRAP